MGKKGEMCFRWLLKKCCGEDTEKPNAVVKTYTNNALAPDTSQSVPPKLVSTSDTQNEYATGNQSKTSLSEIQLFDQSGQKNVYVATWDFKALAAGDLSFHKFERLLITSDTQGDWWYGKSLETNKEGNIPSNYIAKDNSYQSEEWYFGDIERPEAERRLKASSLLSGTFLVRKAATSPGNFSLSLVYNGQVHHYKIHKLGPGRYGLNPNRTFPSLVDVINHYKSVSDGLVCALTKPCPHVKPQMLSLGKDTWEIDREQIIMKRKLGAGQFGEVWLGLWENSTEVAIKTLKENTMSPDSFLAEASVMKTLRHKNLVQLLAICSDREPIYIITEFMCNGSLADFLKKFRENELLKQKFLIDMMVQVASGMAYLEVKDYVHRDLAARNILVGEDYVCKVADFGLTRLLKDQDYYKAQEGAKLPIKWIAPESIFYNRFTTKSDVWSFGILMTEIITKGKNPYPGRKNRDVVTLIEAGGRMEIPDNCAQWLYDIMLECWQQEPEHRPTFKNLRDTISGQDYADVY